MTSSAATRREPVSAMEGVVALVGVTDCPACCGRQARRVSYPTSGIRPFIDLTIRVCSKCGLGIVNETLSPEVVSAYYRDLYGLKGKRDAKEEPGKYFSDRKYMFKPKRAVSQVKLAERFVEGHVRVARVLDFGAGLGTTLHFAKMKWPVATLLAVEPDPLAWAYLDHLNAARVEHLAAIESDSADIVFTSHTLEHISIRDLPAVLGELRRILKRGGIIVGEVPNADFNRFLLTDRRHDPHLLFFTRDACARMLRKSGLEIKFISTVGRRQVHTNKLAGLVNMAVSKVEGLVRDAEYSSQGRIAIRFVAGAA